MEKLKPRTLSGFMELLPAPQQKFERMLEILRKNFALYGFAPSTPPLSSRQKSCWPRAAVRRKSRFTALKKETAIWRCGLT